MEVGDDWLVLAPITKPISWMEFQLTCWWNFMVVTARKVRIESKVEFDDFWHLWTRSDTLRVIVARETQVGETKSRLNEALTTLFYCLFFFLFIWRAQQIIIQNTVRVKACPMDLFHAAASDQFSSNLNLQSQKLRENRRISISQISEGVRPPRMTGDHWRLKPIVPITWRLFIIFRICYIPNMHPWMAGMAECKIRAVMGSRGGRYRVCLALVVFIYWWPSRLRDEGLQTMQRGDKRRHHGGTISTPAETRSKQRHQRAVSIGYHLLCRSQRRKWDLFHTRNLTCGVSDSERWETGSVYAQIKQTVNIWHRQWC